MDTEKQKSSPGGTVPGEKVPPVLTAEDVAALVSAAGCGVTLLATAHGAGREDLSRRKLYRGLLEEGVFRRLVRIHREAGRRIYEVEVLE